MDVEVTVYKVTVCSAVFGTEDDPEEIHHFIMDALTEGRIDLATANLLLAQCHNPGRASKL